MFIRAHGERGTPNLSSSAKLGSACAKQCYTFRSINTSYHKKHISICYELYGGMGLSKDGQIHGWYIEV